MPVKTGVRKGKVRVIEVKTGRIARAKKRDGTLGKARDGGGYPNTPTGKTKAGRVVKILNWRPGKRKTK